MHFGLYVLLNSKKIYRLTQSDSFLRIGFSKLNGSNNRSETLLIELKSFKKSNSLKRNGVPCAVLELRLYQFGKTLFFNSKMTALYILVSRNQTDLATGLKICS